MSLINQMLRDLDKRNGQTAEPIGLSNVKAVETRPGAFKLIWLGLLVPAALAFALIRDRYPFQDVQSPPTTPQKSPAPGEKNNAEGPSKDTVAYKLPVYASRPEDAAVKADVEPSPSVKEQGEGMKSDDSRPPSSLAPTREENGLLQAPKEGRAESGSDLRAQPKDTEQQTAAEASKARSPVSAPISPIKPSKPAADKTPAPLVAQELKSAKSATPTEQAEHLYRQAKGNASLMMARENLTEALTLEPSHLPTRILLLQNLLKAHAEDSEVAGFADESLGWFPSHPIFLKTRAHLYVKQQNFAAAAQLLERIDAETVDDAAYLSLLAACYQQLHRFPPAASLYQKLIALQPEKAEHWLGLAMALDGQQQNRAAIEAYKQALDKKTLNAEVVGYINRRLVDLTR